MQVKKFEAPTIQEALDTIKRELGPEAIILQTKKNRKGFGLLSQGSVEVTVAVSDRSLQKKKYADVRLPEETRKTIQNMPADRQAEIYDNYFDKHLERRAGTTQDKVEVRTKAPVRAPVAASPAPAAPAPKKKLTETRYADIQDDDSWSFGKASAAQVTSSAAAIPAQVARQAATPQMEKEIERLKEMITEMQAEKSAPSGSSLGALFSTPALQDGFEHLLLNGVDRRYAVPMIKQAGFELGKTRAEEAESVLDELTREILDHTEVMSLLDGTQPGNNQVVALVGPTGVGKTTTIAKIAGEASKNRQLKVGLINLDTDPTAFDRLATYARILNLPFRSAASLDDLKSAIADFKGLDLVLVDCAGISQKESEQLKKTETMLHSIPNLRCELVLSASTRDSELYDMVGKFGIFRPEGLIISKLDEATSYGSIYNVSQKAKLPLIYFTTGQRVPEDLEEASRERVAALVMDL